MRFYETKRRKPYLSCISMIIFIAGAFSGCKDKDTEKTIGTKETVKICGPLRINTSGDLLFCPTDTDSDSSYQPYIIKLKNRRSQPIALRFPGSNSCLGATWISRAGYDELLFVTRIPQTIKRFRVDDASVSEISSYTVDPNLMVTVYPEGSNQGNVLAFRVLSVGGSVAKSGSVAKIGLSKDYGQTINISDIPAPYQLLWIDQRTFYMNYSEGSKFWMCMAQLDIDSMTVQTHEILRKDGNILLANKSLNGSLVYVTGNKLFRDNEILTELPEKLLIPAVNGNYIACFSEDKTYILSEKGEVIDTNQRPKGSMVAGLSAVNKCIYLTTEDRTKLIGYNFIEKSENVVFNPNSAP